MAFYLVKTELKEELSGELRKAMEENAFINLQPFGRALTFSLRNARIDENMEIVWEEEDYCTPPLAEERAAVLDKYFQILQIEKVDKGAGWEKIRKLPKLFPELEKSLNR
ncbi:MAG TPA: hypothetical protein VMT35_08685 [Ignavibacteriaceae bacterium]|nr:hypothetical protein [Ignavibacteriaceae bacterium]